MKKVLIALTIIIATTLVVVELFSQGQGRRGRVCGNNFFRGNDGYHLRSGRGGYANIDYLQTKLKLSTEQAGKIRKLYAEHRENIDKNRGNHDKIIELRNAYWKAVENNLTSEQKNKWLSLRDNNSFAPYGNGPRCKRY